MRFQVLEVSYDVIRSLRQPLRRIPTSDPKLYRQIRDAASSISPVSISFGVGRPHNRLYTHEVLVPRLPRSGGIR